MFLHLVHNISEYITTILEIQNKYDPTSVFWFRGESNSSYKLCPKGLRNAIPTRDARGYPLQKNHLPLFSQGLEMSTPSMELMRKEFSRKAIPYLKYQPKNDFELMFIAQHYGLPTRLLDWSDSPLTALFFAFQKDLKKDEEFTFEYETTKSLIEANDEFPNDGVAIYVVDPCKINLKTTSTNQNRIIDVIEEYDEWKHYLSIGDDFPICIYGHYIDDRLQAQSGNFILWGNFTKHLSDYQPINKLLHKIIIPNSCVKQCQKELKMLSINNTFVFPDLEHLIKDIMNKEHDTFNYLVESGKLYAEE